MTYRPGMDGLQMIVGRWMRASGDAALATKQRDQAIRDAYLHGSTLQAIADATGLTRQRIQQIVSERGER
jgi:DNA-directed RNA polymerase sigma subunit (sigma70/sigma32)